MSRNPLPNLVLAGFMGTGKTTAGALLASRLHWILLDTDEMVEREAAMSIPAIFDAHGEPAFREMESRACLRAAAHSHAVISTGGGALLDPRNRAALEQSGVIVLLTCDREALAARLEASALRGERPLLGDDFARRIDDLLAARQPVYSTIPLQVDTTHLTPGEVARQVMALYSQAAREKVPA